MGLIIYKTKRRIYMNSILKKLGIKEINSGACIGSGKWIKDPKGKELVSYNPSSGEPIAKVIQVSPEGYETVSSAAHAGAGAAARPARRSSDARSFVTPCPDVCFTPPENPATPPGVPVPYPNTGNGIGHHGWKQEREDRWQGGGAQRQVMLQEEHRG
jgi:hypothetical protein